MPVWGVKRAGKRAREIAHAKALKKKKGWYALGTGRGQARGTGTHNQPGE